MFTNSLSSVKRASSRKAMDCFTVITHRDNAGVSGDRLPTPKITSVKFTMTNDLRVSLCPLDILLHLANSKKVGVTEINLLQLFFSIEPTKEQHRGHWSFAVIIGVLGAVFYAVSLAGICLVRSRQKKNSVRRERRGLGDTCMPVEEAFPNPEKYQLKLSKSEDNIVYFEEVDIRLKAIEGKANESFC